MSPRDLDKPRKRKERQLLESHHIRVCHSNSDTCFDGKSHMTCHGLLLLEQTIKEYALNAFVSLRGRSGQQRVLGLRVTPRWEPLPPLQNGVDGVYKTERLYPGKKADQEGHKQWDRCRAPGRACFPFSAGQGGPASALHELQARPRERTAIAENSQAKVLWLRLDRGRRTD